MSGARLRTQSPEVETRALNISRPPETGQCPPALLPRSGDRLLAPLVVAVPARNERERIGAALRALAAQDGENSRSLSVVVLANNCTDDTAAQARRVLAGLNLNAEVIEEDFPAEHAHVGRARGRALELAAARLEGHPQGLLASTDADTVPAPDWAAQMRLALHGGGLDSPGSHTSEAHGSPAPGGADLVGGRILTLPGERDQLPAGLRRLQLQDAAYHLLAARLNSLLDPDPHDPWPRHHQHFGANLGLRLSAWRQLGAWPQVRCLEDVALVQAMRRLDLRVRHCPRVRVWTSARDCGRVETGLSSQLREWRDLQASGGSWTVPGAAELRAAAEAGAGLRAAWNTPLADLGRLEQRWKVLPGALIAALTAPTLGLAREWALEARHAAGLWSDCFPAVALSAAVQELRSLIADLERIGSVEV